MIKKHLNKLYLVLALCYSVLLPIIALLYNYFSKPYVFNYFKIFPITIGIISSLALIVFIIDCIINKTNVIKFIKNNKSVIFLLLSLLFLGISCLNAQNKQIAFFGDNEYTIRFGGWISFVFYVFLAIMGYKLNLKSRNIFFRSLIYMTSIISVISFFDVGINTKFIFYEYAGIFFNINHFASYLVYVIVITMFMIYNNKNKILNILDFICFTILIGMLIINNTFGCYLTILFIFIMSIILVIKNKFIFKYIIMLAIFVLLSVTVKVNDRYIVKENFNELFRDLGVVQKYVGNYSENTSEENDNMYEWVKHVGTNRWWLWDNTFKLIKKKPLIGYGLENLFEEYQKLPSEYWSDMPHNLILHLLAVGGLLTVVPYLIAYVLILGKKRKDFYINSDMTVVYFIILAHLCESMFNNIMFYVTSLYAIMFGMIYRKYKND